VSARADSSDIRVELAAALLRSDVEGHYDEDIDELELVLPGSAGREGRAVLVNGELYVRLDVDTGAPLSVIIPGFSSWVERQRARNAPGASADPVDPASAPASEPSTATGGPAASAPGHGSGWWHRGQYRRDVAHAVRRSSELAPAGRRRH
jgi:hypothetical protein